MGKWNFIKSLIKNANKVTKDADKAEVLQEYAGLADMYKNSAKNAIQDNKTLIKNNKDIIEAEKLDPGFNSEYQDFLDEFDRNRYLAGDASSSAREQQSNVNNLLNEIIRQKQREVNPKKLRLNDYINRKDPNFYKRPHRARSHAWDSDEIPYYNRNDHLNFTESMDRDVMDLFLARRGLLNRINPENNTVHMLGADEALEQAEHNKWLEEQIKPEILKKFFEEGF